MLLHSNPRFPSGPWQQLNSEFRSALCHPHVLVHSMLITISMSAEPPLPSHLTVNSVGYHHYPCPKALHKAGPQSMDTESGHWIPSFVQGFKTPGGRHERHLKDSVALLSAIYSQCRQCPLGNSWEGMFMTHVASIAELCAGC